jgi:hypothetical protein
LATVRKELGNSIFNAVISWLDLQCDVLLEKNQKNKKII